MLGHHHFYNSSRSKKEVLFLLLLFSLNSCENRTSTKNIVYSIESNNIYHEQKQYKKLYKTNKEQRREVMYKKLMTCLESVQKKIDFKPEVALILGSGLGDFADGIKIEQMIEM